MKKLFMLMAILVCLFGISSLSYSEVLVSTCVSSFNLTIDTTSATGKLISETKPLARIKHITISWLADSSTATVRLYTNSKVTPVKANLCYELRLGTGTSIPNIHKEEYSMGVPKVARYGLWAVCDNKDNKTVTVQVEWW